MSKLIPILYSSRMVRAKMAGFKSMTRRLRGLEEINENPDRWEFCRFFNGYAKFTEKHNGTNEKYVKSPYGQAGDVLWTRESFIRIPAEYDYALSYINPVYEERIIYKADDKTGSPGPWKPSIHMPYSACRSWDLNTGTWVERLQDISNVHAIDEGVLTLGNEFDIKYFTEFEKAKFA